MGTSSKITISLGYSFSGKFSFAHFSKSLEVILSRDSSFNEIYAFIVVLFHSATAIIIGYGFKTDSPDLNFKNLTIKPYIIFYLFVFIVKNNCIVQTYIILLFE